MDITTRYNIVFSSRKELISAQISEKTGKRKGNKYNIEFCLVMKAKRKWVEI